MTTATEISRHFQISPGVGGCHPDLSLGGWYPGGQVLVASAVLAEDRGWWAGGFLVMSPHLPGGESQVFAIDLDTGRVTHGFPTSYLQGRTPQGSDAPCVGLSSWIRQSTGGEQTTGLRASVRTIRVMTQHGSGLTHTSQVLEPRQHLLWLVGIILVIASLEHLLYTTAHTSNCHNTLSLLDAQGNWSSLALGNLHNGGAIK